MLPYDDWVKQVRYTVSTRHLREEADHLDEIHLAIQSVIYHHMEFGSRFIMNDGVSLNLLWSKHCPNGEEMDGTALMAMMKASEFPCLKLSKAIWTLTLPLPQIGSPSGSLSPEASKPGVQN